MSCIHREFLRRLQLTNMLTGSEKEIEFEKKSSTFLSGKDLVGKSNIVLKVLDEIRNERTDYGMKPTGTVQYFDGTTVQSKVMRFNQLLINYLIEKTQSKESKAWVGVEIPIKLETIKGNIAIVPKESV